jgi:NAD(P)H dehydrogenase (quinone)
MNFNSTMLPEDLASVVTHKYTDEVKAEQEDALWADAYVTICPVWFGMVPGFLKGYFDKVFITGFAYGHGGVGKLQGKRIYSLFTFGAENPYLDLSNQFNCLNTLWDNLFGMVGFSDVATKFFEGVPRSTDEMRKQYLEESKEFVNQIFDKEVGETGQLGHGALLSTLASTGAFTSK